MPMACGKVHLAALCVLAVLMLAPNGAAIAQSGGWGPRQFCSYGGSWQLGIGGPNCVYYTWDQCIASARGTSETCMANPFWRGEPTPTRPARKHVRRS